jgi:CHAD domain-containing protein
MSARATDTTRFALKLLREQYDIVLASEPGVLAGHVEALHDMRVAIRRLRNLLKAFRKALPRPETDTLEVRFQRFSKKLGSARDMDVWMRALKSMRPTGSEPWRQLIDHQREIQERKKEAVCLLLADPSTRELKARFERFLIRPAGNTDVALEKIASRAIRKSLERALARSRLPPSLPAHPAHLLRIACRRARYMAEFFAGTKDKSVARLARRLKAVQDVLGDIHDCDICLEHLRRAPFQPLEWFAELEWRRQTHVARFDRAWDRLARAMPPFTCQSPAAKAH